MSNSSTTPAPSVPTFSAQLITSLGQKVGTGIAVLLAQHGWLASADQATTAAQIGAIVVGALSIAWTIYRDHAQVQTAKALANAPKANPPVA
jgi:hypothetical protein